MREARVSQRYEYITDMSQIRIVDLPDSYNADGDPSILLVSSFASSSNLTTVAHLKLY